MTSPATRRVERFCLLVVAKAPVAGEAKTRLCPPATPEQAAEIAAAALLDTLAAVRATPGAVPVVAMTGDLSRACARTEIPAALAGLPLVTQRGHDFAARLAHAHADAARLYPGIPVVQIGMDTPQVTPHTLTAATARLDEAPAVLGPARDGGWWLLALRDPLRAQALCGVPMSRADTGIRTVEALAAAGVPTTFTTTLTDVDTMADARRVAALVPDGRFASAVAAVQLDLGVSR